MAISPSTRLGRYEIRSQLGAGGMGEVYLAQDTKLDRKVALKILPANIASNRDRMERFVREAKAAAALNHPAIAHIYEIGESDSTHFIAMEFIDGDTLREKIHHKQTDLKKLLKYLIQVAEGLTKAHAASIVHRDLKPDNIMVTRDDYAKILDFGLAKLVEQLKPPNINEDGQSEAATAMLAQHSQPGMVMGTIGYMSPEQAQGKTTEIDQRSDIFSFGCVLYEAATKHKPFEGDSVIKSLHKVVYEPAPPITDFNPTAPLELQRILRRCLAKDSEERYQTIKEVAIELKELRGEMESAVQEMLADDSHRTQRLSSAPKTVGSSTLSTLSDMLRRPRLSIARLLVAVLVLGLIAGTIWWFVRSTPYKASAEAQRWYEKGTNALRDGAYYQASQALEQAVAVDKKFALAHARLAEALTELDYTERAREALLLSSSLVRNSTLPPLDALYLDAVTATATRDFALAIKSYGEIARLTPDPAHVYVDLGRAYEKNEEMGKAIENYIEATKRDSQYAPAFLRVGVLYGRRQDLASASSWFDRAETIYRAGGNFEGLAEVLYQRGLLLNRVGKLADSREQLRKALETARTTNNQYQQIKALLQLSVVSRTERKTEEAKKYVTEAIDLGRAGGIENLTTQGLIDLGNVYYARGEIDEADKYFKQALEIAQRNKGRRNEARALLSLGSLYIQKDEPDQGRTYVEQALPFYQQGSYRRETSQALLLIGRAKRMKGDYQGALSALEPQLQVAEQAGDKPQLALFHGDIGTVLVQQERYAEGLDHFNKSYAISSLGNQLNAGFDSTLRGDALWRLGQYQEAKTAFSKASAIAEGPDGGHKPLSATIHLSMGHMALSQRQYGDAMAQSRRAIELDDSSVKHTAIEARSVLGLAQALSGARVEGKKSCLEAVGMATHASDPRLLSSAMLALAEALLENGDMDESLTNALRAQERFAATNQQESEWRAWLIAGLASHRLNNLDGARQHLSNAGNVLNGLEKRWGTDHFNTYLARPDVQFYRKQLDKTSLTK
jgi:serine/threonine protein kinase/Tfp pilus assembly protein PilF